MLDSNRHACQAVFNGQRIPFQVVDCTKGQKSRYADVVNHKLSLDVAADLITQMRLVTLEDAAELRLMVNGY